MEQKRKIKENDMKIFNIFMIITTVITMFFINVIVGYCYLGIVIFLLIINYISKIENKYYDLNKYLDYKSELYFRFYFNIKNFPNLYTILISSKDYKKYHSLKFGTLTKLKLFIKNLKSDHYIIYELYKDDKNIDDYNISKIVKKINRLNKIKKIC